MNLDLIDIDDAVLQQLENIGLFKTVNTLDSEEALLEDTSTLLPAAFSLVNGAAYQPQQGNSGTQYGNTTVTVFIKTRSLRGKGDARKSKEGAYALIKLVGDKLLGFSPGTCGPLEFVSIGSIRVTKYDAIYAIVFTASTSEDF